MASTVDILPQFQKLVEQLQTSLRTGSDAALQGGASSWMMPDKGSWSGDLTDYAGIAKLFDRSDANNKYVDITTKKVDGSQGDAQVLQLMIDYTATLQRAFLQRHTMNKSRAFAHATARRRSHGLAYGPLQVTVLEQLRQLVQAGKSEPQTP